MTYNDWLIEIGKSNRTANSYSGAIAGSISAWAREAGLCTKNLDDVSSVDELRTIAEGLKEFATFKEQNKRGNSMYSSALKAYIEYRKREAPEEFEADVNDIMSDNQIAKTEKATYISARVGQGKYRSDLIGYWEKCALTGFADTRFLVASHIKPWRKSSNRERLDPYNGLLLLPNLDKAFDLGFITFASGGHIIVSNRLEDESKLGVSRDMHLSLEDCHQEYMEFHRDVVFERLV
ncbi:MAG: HNH endonuclease [Gammaproteobacteria bacterium]